MDILNRLNQIITLEIIRQRESFQIIILNDRLKITKSFFIDIIKIILHYLYDSLLQAIIKFIIFTLVTFAS
jgi:hypothetical protein